MSTLNRRDFLVMSGKSLVGMTLSGVGLVANAQQQLNTDDPTAQALKYVHSSAVQGQNCNNCMYIQGKGGTQWRSCAIFPNKLVNAKGWCNAWVKKPS